LLFIGVVSVRNTFASVWVCTYVLTLWWFCWSVVYTGGLVLVVSGCRLDLVGVGFLGPGVLFSGLGGSFFGPPWGRFLGWEGHFLDLRGVEFRVPVLCV